MASVDVFVPCYNYGRYLPQAVESVLSQQGVEVRVLVIDDASTDDTPELGAALARRDSRVAFRRHAVNRRHIATYNEGIGWIGADYCLLLSADDYLLPDALARATALMDADPSVGFAFGCAYALLESGDRIAMRPLGGGVAADRVIPGADFIRRSGGSNIVPTPTAVVRTSLQKAVGGYRPELPHSGDMEMWLRLAARGAVGYVDAALAVYRLHSSNMSRDYFAAVLPDFQQRHLAIDMFLTHSGHLLDNPARLRRRMMRHLAGEVLKSASMAFNSGKTDLSGELTNYARELDPAIRRSPHWWRIAAKRRLGPKAWTALSGLGAGS